MKYWVEIVLHMLKQKLFGIALPISFIAVVLLFNGSLIFAQISGDLRNTTFSIDTTMHGDMPTNIMNYEEGNILGGITVKGGEKVSFDEYGSLKTNISGFWKPESDIPFWAVFRDSRGDDYALIEIKGTIRWNDKRNLIEGKENFLRIVTRFNKEKYINISKRTFKNGFLKITTEEGKSFLLKKFSPDFTGLIIP